MARFVLLFLLLVFGSYTMSELLVLMLSKPLTLGHRPRRVSLQPRKTHMHLITLLRPKSSMLILLTSLFLTPLICSCATSPGPLPPQCVQQSVPQRAFQKPIAQSSIRATLAPPLTKSDETQTPK